MGTAKSHTRSANARSATARASSAPRTASTGTINPPPVGYRGDEAIRVIAELFGHRVAWDVATRCLGNVGRTPDRRLTGASRAADDWSHRRGVNMGIFKKKPTEAAATQTSPDMQDFMQREMDKIFGRRGPAHLVALIPNPGVAELGRVTWTAIPSWDPAHMVADGINAQARRAGTRVSRTGIRRCQIRCSFMSATSSRPAFVAMVVWLMTAAARNSAWRSAATGLRGSWNANSRPSQMFPTSGYGRHPEKRGADPHRDSGLSRRCRHIDDPPWQKGENLTALLVEPKHPRSVLKTRGEEVEKGVNCCHPRPGRPKATHG
jgi:hypothetical protein